MSEILESERAKYRRVWSEARGYRRQADGLPVVDAAWRYLGMERGDSLIDWGAGSGLPAAEFAARGLKVTAFDIADNCLDPAVRVPLVVGTLWDPPADLAADYGFCTDVLEHIPTVHVRDCLREIRNRSRRGALLQVDTVLDISGPRMDPPERLHLTVWSREQWEETIGEFWPTVRSFPGTYSRWVFLCVR